MTCPCHDSPVASGETSALARLRTLCHGLAICALLTAAAAAPAAAADLLDDSFLRGSLGGAPVRWDGVVLGGQFGYTNMNTDFKNVSTVAQPPNTATSSTSYGGFLGYNIQWDDLVLGLDGGYTRASSLQTSSQATALGTTVTSQLKLTDYATVRARAGYAFGQFLPYGFVGAAIGRMNYSTVSGGVSVANRDNAINGGFTAGLGVDVAILPNVFLRGEWEYIAFGQVSGIRATDNTGRVGIGVRF